MKYVIGYNDYDGAIRRSSSNGYVKCFDSIKTMSFKVNENELLKKYTKIWKKVSNLMNIKFGSEPIFGDNDKYIKTKIKIYRDKTNTNFQGKKIPKENALYKCLSLIMLDSVIIVNCKYYPQILLEECRHEIKKSKMENLINDDLKPSSSDDESVNESDNESDNEYDNEPDTGSQN